MTRAGSALGKAGVPVRGNVWINEEHRLRMKGEKRFESYLGIYMEKAVATHSSTLAWKISWVEKPGRLQLLGLQRVRHDWVTSLHFLGISEISRSFNWVKIWIEKSTKGMIRIFDHVFELLHYTRKLHICFEYINSVKPYTDSGR